MKPLPYREPGRLANIWVDLGVGNQSLPAVSPGDFRDYQQRSRLFESFAAGTGPLSSARPAPWARPTGATPSASTSRR